MAISAVTLEPATVVMTGIEFRDYGNRYLDAAEHLSRKASDKWFDPLPYQLVCQSLELHLKSYIWLTDGLSRNDMKGRYGHNIEKLWRKSKMQGISRYCRTTQARDRAIGFLGPYYKARKFAYLDIVMSGRGIPELRQRPEEVKVIMRLCQRLRVVLEEPILRAS